MILDLSDLKKKYAEKMEYLATVRDGSEDGNLSMDTGPTRSLPRKLTVITPLYYSLYSQKSPDFESENREIIKGFGQIGRAVQNRGIWVIDCEVARDDLYEALLKN